MNSKRRVRTAHEYCDFVNRVIPEVNQRRNERTKRVDAAVKSDNTLIHKVMTAIGFYKHTSMFNPYEPLAR